MSFINLFPFQKYRPPDLYHTCYTLSGVSISQHSEAGADPFIIGDLLTNELLPTHPLYNAPPKCVWQAFVHFQDECESGESSFVPNAGSNSDTNNHEKNDHS